MLTANRTTRKLHATAHWLLLITVIFNFALSPVVHAVSLDMDAPTVNLDTDQIHHVPGEGYLVSAKITDQNGISEARLMIKAADSNHPYQPVNMQFDPTSQSYLATIPDNLVKNSDVLFYIEAKDQAGNITQFPSPGKAQSLAAIKTEQPAPVIAKPVAKPVIETPPAIAPKQAVAQPNVRDSSAVKLPEMNTPQPEKTPEKSGTGKYVLFGLLGVAVLAGLAGGGGGDSSGATPGDNTGTLGDSETTTTGVVQLSW